jgi:hypothetical protein
MIKTFRALGCSVTHRANERDDYDWDGKAGSERDL